MLTLVALACGASPAAGQCGQDYHGAPAHSDTPGGPPLAIGDSVLADAVPELVRAGFEADGMVCRQMSQGIALLQTHAPHLPHLVVLALGTNGEVTPGEIDTALSILGPQRILALVTPHDGVIPSTPQVIRAAAASHPGRILLLDWDSLAAGHQDWFAPDGIHLGGSAGTEAFAQMVASLLPYATPVSEERSTPTIGTPVTIQPAHHRNPAAAHHPRAQSRPQRVTSASGHSSTEVTNPALTIHPALGHSANAAVSRRTPNHAALLIFGILVASTLAVAALWRRKRR
jgi:hypothetical protein